MDHNKTSLPRLQPLPKDCNQAPQLPVSLFGILTHGHNPGAFMHYFVQSWPGDPNLTIASISKCLVNLERHKQGVTPRDTVAQELHKALADDKALLQHREHQIQQSRFGVPFPVGRFGTASSGSQTSEASNRSVLPPHLLLQLDNCASENKNRWVFAYFALLVARGCFKSIRVTFLMVGHTHEDVDALFSHVSESLRRETCYTFPHMLERLKECISNGVENHLITEVPDFKSFLKGYILDGKEEMTGHSKPLTFLFTMRDGIPVFQYKMRSYDKVWLPQTGVEVFKRDSSGLKALLPTGEPEPVPPQPLDSMVVGGLKRYVEHWKKGLDIDNDGQGYRTRMEPVIEYWERIIKILQKPPEVEPRLREEFWPSSSWKEDYQTSGQSVEGNENESDDGTIQQEHYVGPRNQKPFDIHGIGEGWYVLVRPEDTHFPVWLGRCVANVDKSHVRVEWYHPYRQNGESEEDRYNNWWVKRWIPNPTDPELVIGLSTIAHGFYRKNRCKSISIPGHAVTAAAEILALDISRKK